MSADLDLVVEDVTEEAWLELVRQFDVDFTPTASGSASSCACCSLGGGCQGTCGTIAPEPHAPEETVNR